jgi:hypothetical protein
LDESWGEFGLAFCDGGQARGSVVSAFGVAGCGAAGAGGVAGVGGAWAIAISGVKHATIAAKRTTEFRITGNGARHRWFRYCDFRYRINEKCPIGGIGVRSASSTRP